MSLLLLPGVLCCNKFFLGIRSVFARLSNRVLEFILLGSQGLRLVNKMLMFGLPLIPIATEQSFSIGTQPMDRFLKAAALRDFWILGGLLSQALHFAAEFFYCDVTIECLRGGLYIVFEVFFEFIEPLKLPFRRISCVVESPLKHWVIRIRWSVTQNAAQDVITQRTGIPAEKSNKSLTVGGSKTRPGAVPPIRFFVGSENQCEPLIPVQCCLGSRELCEHRLKSHYFTFLVVSWKF